MKFDPATMYERDVWETADCERHFGVSAPTVAKFALEGGMPHMRLGRLWRFKRVDVLAWQTEQQEKAKKGAA